MLGAEVHWLSVPVSDAAQSEYNKRALDGLTKLGFPGFVESTLVPLMNFDDADFAKFTVLKTVKSWMGEEDDRNAQAETEEETPYRPRRGVRGIPLGTIYFSEKLRALRFTLDEMRNRVWRTYDATETKTVERKVNGKVVNQTFKVCDPDRATYRVGDHNRTSLEYTEFCSYLLEAYKYFEKFDEDLTQFSSVFRTASGVAHKMRTETKQKAFEEKKKLLSEVKPATKPAPKPTKPAEKFTPAAAPAENAWALRKQAAQAKKAEPAEVEAETAETAEAETAETAETAEPVEAETNEDTQDGVWKSVPLNKKGQRVESAPRQRGRGRRFKQN
jgi:hypothetical protein